MFAPFSWLLKPFGVLGSYVLLLVNAFVSMDDGSGIVHLSPAFGAEDLEIGRREGWPLTISLPRGYRKNTRPCHRRFL